MCGAALPVSLGTSRGRCGGERKSHLGLPTDRLICVLVHIHGPSSAARLSSVSGAKHVAASRHAVDEVRVVLLLVVFNAAKTLLPPLKVCSAQGTKVICTATVRVWFGIGFPLQQWTAPCYAGVQQRQCVRGIASILKAHQFA